MKKSINVWIAAFVIMVSIVSSATNIFAATGKTTIAVSENSVNIGDTVNVTVKAVTASGDAAHATMTLEYNSDILEFSSCSETYGGGNGTIRVTADKFTVKFKAVAEGKSGLTVTAEDGVDFSTNNELDSVEGCSTNITVNNATSNSGTKLSADNSLKSLTISPGKLSPEFKGSTVNYKATVANDVTSIAVNAVVANEKAIVESVSGNTNLSVGENVVKIVVKAENGTTATYAIKVTRQAAQTDVPANSETPGNGEGKVPEEEIGVEEISFKGGSYCVVNKIPEHVIPSGFTNCKVYYHGEGYPGLSFDNGTISLLYLVKADLSDPTGVLAIYDETRDLVYPYTRLTNGKRYVMPLLAPVDVTIPDDYSATEFLTEQGEKVSAYQLLEGDEWTKDFYLFYGMNQDGEEAWYQYDAAENTYQRAFNAFKSEEDHLLEEQYEYLNQKYQELKETYRQESEKNRNLLYSMIFAVAVLLIVVLNVVIFKVRSKRDEKDSLDGPKIKEKKPAKKEVEWFDFNDKD